MCTKVSNQGRDDLLLHSNSTSNCPLISFVTELRRRLVPAKRKRRDLSSSSPDCERLDQSINHPIRIDPFLFTSQASRARLFKEYKEVQREKSADPDIQLVCDDSNIFKWTALIKGPSETPYEGGVFQLAFAVPEQYPLQPPQVRFLTKIFHPNVHFKTGEICLDILKNAWSPAWTLQSVCRAIIALMAHPEPDSPLNCDSGNLLRSGDTRGFHSMARMYTKLAAMPKKG
ncbi:PEROXIN-4-like protein [Drosera capensis]